MFACHSNPRVFLSFFLHLAFTHDPANIILFRLKYKVALCSVYTCSKEINNLQAAKRQAACKINMCLMLDFRSAEFVVVMAVVVYNCNGENGLDRSVPSRFVARASAGVFKSDVKRQNNLLQTGWNNSELQSGTIRFGGFLYGGRIYSRGRGRGREPETRKTILDE